MLLAVEALWLILAVAVMAGFAWLGFRIEPHWVAKDLSRFLCNAQLMTDKGEPVGRWRETKILVEPNGELIVDQRKWMRRQASSWRVVAESESPPRRRAVFLLRGHDPKGVAAMLAVRLPASSKAVPILKNLVGKR
jgi:hypothetical protein